MSDYFQLRRRTDDLIYHFDLMPHATHGHGYKRRDGDYWILYHGPDVGWIAWNDDANECSGRPWHVPPADQSADHPPPGEWVSKKRRQVVCVRFGSKPIKSVEGGVIITLNNSLVQSDNIYYGN